MMNSSLQFQYLSPQVGFSSVVSGGQSDLSLIPQGLCQSKLHQLMPKVSVCSRAPRFNEFNTGHQAALRTCLVLNHLCPDNFPEIPGSMSSTQGTRQPLGPALCSTTFAQTTFQRAQWAREANWETLSSLHSPEPTGLTPERVHSTA